MTHRKKEKVIINPLPEGTLLTGGKQQYRIKKALGQGSFGITYRATTLMQGPLGAIEIDVAVKEFFMLSYNSRQGSSVTYGGSDDLFMHYKQMFAREARNLSSLNHRNIVKVLEYFEANNTYYYVMEYCRGGSLNEKIAEKDHLSEEESLHYFAQLTSAVSHMHDHKMLHLDIKPDNIVLRENGELVLIDFGLSKQYTADGRPETSTSIGLGTPGYAPIEQAKHRRDSKDFAATLDVYAVGATLFKMLTGQRPPEAADVMEGFPAYMLLEKGVNTHLIQCISKAMSLRTKRYPTIRHFVQDIAHEIDLEDDTDIEDEGKTDVNDENKTPYDRRHPAPEPIIIDIEPEIVEPREEQEMEKPQKPRRNTSWLWVALVGISVGVSAILGLRGCQSHTGGNPDVTDSLAIEVIAETTLTQDDGRGASQARETADDTEKTKLEEENRRLREKIRQDSIEAVKQAEAERQAQELAKQIAAEEARKAREEAERKKAEQARVSSTSGYINGHEWVDLGLSVKWATCNVGASIPSSYGNYYAWGETRTKSTYTEDNSTTYGKSYGDISGDARYDAARANWGGSWRMPTRAEYQELIDNCTLKWTTQNGVNGYRVTSKKNGNSIFLPAAGWRYGSSLSNAGEYGLCWSSSPDASGTEYAYSLYFISSDHYVGWGNRLGGRTVRPVCD